MVTVMHIPCGLPGWQLLARYLFSGYGRHCKVDSLMSKLVHYLNQYVVGQENAKKVLSVAYVSLVGISADCTADIRHRSVFNHYNRVHANMKAMYYDEPPHLSRSDFMGNRRRLLLSSKA